MESQNLQHEGVAAIVHADNSDVLYLSTNSVHLSRKCSRKLEVRVISKVVMTLMFHEMASPLYSTWLIS
jgi:hypothetical protein